MTVVVPLNICRDPEAARTREWLETNGRGGYAMGPMAGGARRRYHGLLTTALQPPMNRFQLVNRLDETAVLPLARFDVSGQTFPGVVADGPPPVETFRLDPFPTWTYVFGSSRVEKSFFLRFGEDTAVVIYRLVSGPPLDWEVRPLLSFRDHHALGRKDDRFEGKCRRERQGFFITSPGGRNLSVWMSTGEFVSDPAWVCGQSYGEDESQGSEFHEDVYGPGLFRFSLDLGKTAYLVMSLAQQRGASVEMWEGEERDQRQKLARNSLVRGSLGRVLSVAADQFIVSWDKGTCSVAGYPWAGVRSREALISFPGLFLATGRWQEGKSLLDMMSRHAHEGLLPVFFPEGKETVSYASADAPLWLVRAVQAYYGATHDEQSLRRWLPVLRDIVDAYQRGAGHGIHMDGDGLIRVPESDAPLTWMDARVEGQHATLRGGKPVEIQALWYNALQFLVEVQMKLKEPTRGYESLAEISWRSFNEKFWNEDRNYPCDVIDGKHRDGSLRPNALLTLSLPYEILTESRFLPVVEKAEASLWTPWGLRSLAPTEEGYKGRCGEYPFHRDAAALHQGTIHPWLMGPFLTAYIKAHGSSDETKQRVSRFLDPFKTHVLDGCVGQVSQALDGDMPHALRGAPAHAVAVGELLRVMWEEGITR